MCAWFEIPAFDNGSLKTYKMFLLINMLDCLGFIQMFAYSKFI